MQSGQAGRMSSPGTPGRPDGLFSWCRECQSEHGAARRAARQVAIEGEKPCTKCGETKPVDEVSAPAAGRAGGNPGAAPAAARLTVPGIRPGMTSPARRLMRASRAGGPRARTSCVSVPAYMPRNSKRRSSGTTARMACCGATENLTIDHIAGNGTQHGENLFGNAQSARRFWRWLVTQGFPAGYRTLCGSCNSSKGTSEACRLER